MFIECPECGTKNATNKPIQPGKRYRCGKCGALITLPQTNDIHKENAEITSKQINEIYRQVDREKEDYLLEVQKAFKGLDERDRQLVIAADIGIIEPPARLSMRVDTYRRLKNKLFGLVAREGVPPIDNEFEAEKTLLDQPWWNDFTRELKEKWSIHKENDIGSWGRRSKKLQPYIYELGYYYQTFADYKTSGPFKPTMGIQHIGPRKFVSWRVDIRSNKVVPITLPLSNKLEKGLVLASRGKNEESVVEFSQYIEIKPFDPTAYTVRGDSFADMGQIQSAITDYSRSIELEPNLSEAYDKRAVAYIELRDFRGALQDFNKAIEIHPEKAGYHYNMSLAYVELGDTARTIACCTKAIMLDANFAKAYYNRGIAYNEIKEYDKAISDFDKTINLEPDLIADASFNRGIAYQGKGENDKALVDFRRVLQLVDDPEDIETINNKIRELNK